jgi:hypothetical protein
MLLLGLGVVAVVTASGWVREGEVATLVTFDERGRGRDARLWIVDVDGATYVRAPSEDCQWLARLRGHPIVHLSRGDGLVTVRAEPVEDTTAREAVNHAMHDKYRGFDDLIALWRDPSHSVPVRLEPVKSAQR